MQQRKVKTILDSDGDTVLSLTLSGGDAECDLILESEENGHMANITVYEAYKDSKLVAKVYPYGHTIIYL